MGPIGKITKGFAAATTSRELCEQIVKHSQDLILVDVFVRQAIQTPAIRAAAEKQIVTIRRFAHEPDIGKVRAGAAVWATSDPQ